MRDEYFRPLVHSGAPRPETARSLAGGTLWFTHVGHHRRGHPEELLPVSMVPEDCLSKLTAQRASICGLESQTTTLMGVLNVTPDSFSDGGEHFSLFDALNQAEALLEAGADVLDIGGESTRPGADTVHEADEISRVVPVIEALRSSGVTAPISIDTRKAPVARAAFDAGADIFNDVSALCYDPGSASLASAMNAPVCLMHAQGDPKTMQDSPSYDDILLDVYDFLADRVAAAEDAGIPSSRIIIDPGIGFGKTLEHNLTLIRGLSLFHGIGCPILLGASRKRFIGAVADVPVAADRMPGSIAVALEGLRQGAQMLRIHDVKETRQAVQMWHGLNGSAQRG